MWLHAMGRVDFVTASRERTDFSVPAQIGDVIELAGSVHRVGRSSLSVQIDMAAETPSSGEWRRGGIAVSFRQRSKLFF